MSSFWPPELVQTLAQRRGVVFLGAGASASCSADDQTRMPTWGSLLSELGSKLPTQHKSRYQDFLGNNRFLDAAQFAQDLLEPQELNNYLISVFGNNAIRPSEIYAHVNLIDQPVVMTTNFDRMYERYWEIELNASLEPPRPPLMVSSYTDNDVVDNLRSDRPVLLKLHGTVEKPRDLVLSRSQYARAKYEHANYFKVVSALLLTRTVLFVGCGFNGDPDIDLLLEDSAFTAQSTAPHYALLPEGRHESEKKSLRSGFNLRVLEYSNESGDHAEMMARMAELSELVLNTRT